VRWVLALLPTALRCAVAVCFGIFLIYKTNFKFTINFQTDDFNRLWRMRYCWQLGFIFPAAGLASSLTSLGFFCGGLFARLGNVLACEGLAF
jgi:hypothetical protein